jgi:3'-phosphoadenosine 5'-phosphosulfate sulfotransferase
MQVLNIKRNPSTENAHFSKPIQFTKIYLMQEQKLNPNNYSEQEINMTNFIKVNEHDVHLFAKFGDFTFYGIL